MADFVNYVNRVWETTDAVVLASYVLWRMNWIHPFINGNGRTARAICYFVLCVKAGGWLPGTTILPELIRQNHGGYVAALQAADASLPSGKLDLSVLHKYLSDLLTQQLGTAPGPAGGAATPPGTPAS
jgi:Fic family protein